MYIPSRGSYTADAKTTIAITSISVKKNTGQRVFKESLILTPSFYDALLQVFLKIHPDMLFGTLNSNLCHVVIHHYLY